MAKNPKQVKTIALIVVAAVVLVAAVGIMLRNPPSSSTPADQQMGLSSLTATDDSGDTWLLELAQGPPMYNASDIRVQPGAPLLIKTDVEIIGRDVSAGLIIEGQAGEIYIPGAQKNGQRMSAPGLKVVDEAGNTLTTGTFRYG